MSEKQEPLKNADNYMRHCTKCPLVKEGMPCPVGKFGDNNEVNEKLVEKKEPEKPHFIFTILESCKSATFHFNDGDLTWTKK